MSRVTLPDVEHYIASTIKADTNMTNLFDGEIRIHRLVPADVPKNYIVYRASTSPTQIPGKQNVMDTVTVEISFYSRESSFKASQFFTRGIQLFEKPNIGNPGMVVTSLDTFSRTFVGSFNIENTGSFDAVYGGIAVFGYLLVLSTIAYDYRG